MKCILIIVCMLLIFSDCIGYEGLQASWYSIESLKREGAWKITKGVMANGKLFRDEDYTCATRLYPLGAILRVFNLNNGKYIEVLVTDRIGKRYSYTRVDLSKGAFIRIANLKQGIVPIKIERIR